ncbi:NADP-dependent oxidoreductase domain-containing protein, partial [Amylostereum chailletii]
KEPSNQDIVRRVEEVAKKHGVKMAQVALAWCMTKDVVSAPIVGTTSIEKLKELIDAFDVNLTDEDIKYLEEPYKPMNIIGHA